MVIIGLSERDAVPCLQLVRPVVEDREPVRLGDGVVALRPFGAMLAKDVIDMQITVTDLDTAAALLARAEFVLREHVTDHCPAGMELVADELEKRMFAAPAGERRTNIHVRVDGRFNQLYPLLFRDYLRTHPDAATAIGETKRALARHSATTQRPITTSRILPTTCSWLPRGIGPIRPNGNRVHPTSDRLMARLIRRIRRCPT